MGTIRYAGDLGLHDHEGYVEAELDIPAPYRDGVDHWTSGGGTETDGHETGRHRAACECGWRGQIVDFGIKDLWLPDHLERQVMRAWEHHTDPLIAALGRTGPLTALAEELHNVNRRVEEAIGSALAAGADWSEIAQALGYTEEAARRRWDVKR